MMLEKAKSRMAMAINTGPAEPISDCKADCVRAMPLSSGTLYRPLMRMIKAVHEQTSSVSVKTPNAWISPCLTG